mgnify:CR=1 FL=1
MLYEIRHETRFNYATPVDLSQHYVHLAPRNCPRQSVHRAFLDVMPTPTVMRSGQDYFGNQTTYLTVEQPHSELVIVSSAQVEVHDAPAPHPELTTPWDEIASRLNAPGDPAALAASEHTFQSRFTRSDIAFEYALPSFPPGQPILSGAVHLMHRINADFAYQGGVTDVYTPVDTVFEERRGVCQDFAHLQIACLRALNLPARYVSGYLQTHPPEGKEKLVGADASHAWVSVWTPGYGWVDLDPTNDLLPGPEHITLAWGRDYGDVSPINGMVLGGGDHSVKVSVDVREIGA